jgi:hypothetical protein
VAVPASFLKNTLVKLSTWPAAPEERDFLESMAEVGIQRDSMLITPLMMEMHRQETIAGAPPRRLGPRHRHATTPVSCITNATSIAAGAVVVHTPSSVVVSVTRVGRASLTQSLVVPAGTMCRWLPFIPVSMRLYQGRFETLF